MHNTFVSDIYDGFFMPKKCSQIWFFSYLHKWYLSDKNSPELTFSSYSTFILLSLIIVVFIEVTHYNLRTKKTQVAMFLIQQQLLLYSIFKWAIQNTFKGNILKLRRIVIRG